ncbi:MAG: hypothetical protein Q8880_12355, partial [Bacteroidota bacterium]|nr:hypothetical protein [Bacteroidota bacterium]
LIKNKSRLDYISANNHAFLGISEFVINNINDNQQNHIKSLNYINIYYNFREFHNKRILQINKTNYLITSANKITVDFIIISGNPHISLLRLIQAYNFQQLIIDSSNSIRYATRLISEAKNLGINCYSVLHSGAFEADI